MVSYRIEYLRDTAGKLLNIANIIGDIYPISIVSAVVLPAHLIAVMVLLWYQIKLYFLIPLGMLILVIIIVNVVKRIIDSDKTTHHFSNIKLEKIRELVDLIRLIKFNVWEELFVDQILDNRFHEIKGIRRNLIYTGLCEILTNYSHVLILGITLVLYCITGPISLTSLYTTLLLVFQFRTELLILPHLYSSIYLCYTSLNSITEFLLATVYPDINRNHEKAKYRLRLNGSIRFIEEVIPFLCDLDMMINDRTLCILCGPKKSGKTAIVRTFLGQLDTEQVFVNGSLAYVDGGKKGSWIQNTTLRRNIIFGRQENPQLYDEVVTITGLKQFINTIPEGDNIILDNNTIEFSLRQRIGIARALFSSADIYIFDESLKSLHPVLACYLFTVVIRRYLKNKTVLLVTNEKYYMPFADLIYFLKNDGNYLTGDFIHLNNIKSFKKLKGDYDIPSESLNDEQKLKSEFDKWQNANNTHLVYSYNLVQSLNYFPFKYTLKSANYIDFMAHKDNDVKAYFKYISNGKFVWILSIFLLLISSTSYVATFWWLQYWTIDYLPLSTLVFKLQPL